MCFHLVNVSVPRYHVKKLLGAGAKVLKNLEEETGTTQWHSFLYCSLWRYYVHLYNVLENNRQKVVLFR